MDKYTVKAAQRLWSKTAITADPDKCWEFQAHKVFGYGRIRFQGKYIGAHRLSYILEHGEIPEGLDVLHSCDNPGCVNPKHLFLGTHTENMQDMLSKGRGHKARGQNNGDNKLTPEQVMYIREKHAREKTKHRDLAKEMGVARNTIYCILSRKTWAWL